VELVVRNLVHLGTRANILKKKEVIIFAVYTNTDLNNAEIINILIAIVL